MMEKLDVIAYMVENGYDLHGLTMDEMAAACSVSDLWALCRDFMGEDE